MDETGDIGAAIRAGVAVVTGAGSGLGRALALGLAEAGLTVVALGRRAGPLERLAQQAPAGARIHPLPLDVADPAAVQAGFRRIRDEFGPVTLLLNNAAVFPHRDILDETPESFMATLAVNLGGPLFCAQAVLPDMVARGYGRIVNVGSFAGARPAPAAAAYSVSKGAARILTQALVADLGDRFPDIVISEWMPGILNTAMGLEDGLAPETAAAWGVRLALWHDRGLNGLCFEQDREIVPQVSWKRRLVARLTGRRRVARRLGG